MVFANSSRRAQKERAVGGDGALDAVREGTILGGRYRVRGILGSGGMAVVYEAEDAVLGRRVALKTLHERFAREPSFRARFKQEARAMASLDHENIVKVYDISQNGEAPFIVAELVEGRDVGRMLKEAPGGRLKEEFVREIVRQLLRALAYAHRRGVIHRDVKPSNILVTHGGVVKVADFGIARIVEDDDRGRGRRESEPGEIVGSARYMSPEQLRGEETTPRSDVYSVGVLLYHCLTGRPPFSGDAKSVARQQLSKEPTPPRRLRSDLSRGTEAVILKALQKRPEDRYPSASAMLDALVHGPSANAVHYSRGGSKRRGGGRLLAAAAALAVLLGGGSVAAATLGYGDLSSLPLLGGSGESSEGGDRPAGSGEQQQEEEVASRESGQQEAPAEPARPRETADDRGPEPQREEPELAVVPEPVSEVAPEGTTPAAQEGQNLVPVPNVNEYFDYSAEEILENRGFEARIVYEYREGYADRGVAWATDPAVGTLVPYGSTVTVYATPKDEYQPQIST